MSTLTVTELEATLEKLNLSVPIPQFATADTLNKPLDLVRTYLADILSNLAEADPIAAYNSISLSNDPLHGDLTVVLPRLCSGTKAGDLANDIIKKFPQCPLFSLPWADGIHLRVCVSPQTLPRLLLPYIIHRKGVYGSDSTIGLKDPTDSTQGRKKLIVEFSSPNIASEFQGKHLRSTIIGSFISHFHECMGWDVTRLNYFGDWGKDIALLGVGWEKFGSEEAFQEDPTTHLLEVYHKIHELFLPELLASKKARDEAKKKAQEEVDDTAEIESKGLFAERNEFFKRMENGDEYALSLYKRIRDVNIDNYIKLYARLGIIFDENSGESQVSQETMAEVEQILKNKGICEDHAGSWVIHMQNIGAKTGMAVIRDRSGSSTYLLRYLAAVLERSRKFEFDKMIFVAADKTGHFARLFKILQAMDMTELRGKLQHVQLSDVSHMSHKLGHGHQPHEILNQCEKEMLDSLKADEVRSALFGDSEEVVKLIGITGILEQELSTKRTSEHSFDLNGMASLKPGTGPDLQYWYARLCSILRNHPLGEDLPNEEYGSLEDEGQTSLLLVLGQYPDITYSAFKTLESTPITTYLATVIEHLSDCLDDDYSNDDEFKASTSVNEEPENLGKQVNEDSKEEVAKEGEAVSTEEGDGDTKVEEAGITPAQASLYEAARIVLENGMRLLGLTPIPLPQQVRADTPISD